MKLTSLARSSNRSPRSVPAFYRHPFNTISHCSKTNTLPKGYYSAANYLKMPSQRNPKYGHLPLSTSGPQECALTGTILLNNPIFNKGSAFPSDERRDFNLTGLLPQSVQTLEQQANRAYQQFSATPDDLAKNAFMTSMSMWPHDLHVTALPGQSNYASYVWLNADMYRRGAE